MKNIALIILASVLVSGAYAQSSTRSTQTQSAATEIAVQSEVKDLARGYALAFSQLSRPPLTLVFQKDGQMRVLEDVKGVRAVEGVLIIEVGRGLIYVVNAKDVVYLTDGPLIVRKDENPALSKPPPVPR